MALPPAAQTGSRPLITVLVAEDSLDVLELCEHALSTAGYRVLPATSVETALTLLRAGNHVDLIVADYNLGDGTGSELIHQANNEGLFDASEHPALICTAYRYVELPPQVGMLHKPFDPADLVTRVDDALRSVGRRRTAPHAQEL